MSPGTVCSVLGIQGAQSRRWFQPRGVHSLEWMEGETSPRMTRISQSSGGIPHRAEGAREGHSLDLGHW